jgi:hypothetical protein
MLDNIEKGFTSEQLDAILDVFTSEGWKIIQHDMRLYRKQMDSTDSISTESQLSYLRGELHMLDWFIDLKSWYQAAEAVNDITDL